MEIEVIKNKTIPNLQREIDNIKNVTIRGLQREKENIQADTLRKLIHKLDVELPHKIAKHNEKIAQLKFNISHHNVENSILVGDYVIKSSPVEPKKKLIVVVAFVTGFILSVFMVFFLQFIRDFREEDKGIF